MTNTKLTSLNTESESIQKETKVEHLIEQNIDEHNYTSEKYSDENLESLKFKDKEMYIEFFGTEDEKEALLKEKSIISEELKLKTQQKYTTLVSEYSEVIVELYKEIIELNSSSPEVFALYDLDMITKLTTAHLELTSTLGYIIQSVEVLTMQEISGLRKVLHEYQISDTDSIFEYFDKVNTQLEGRVYPPTTILKMEKALRDIINFSKEYMNINLVQDAYEIPIEMNYLDDNNYTWKIVFSSRKVSTNRYDRDIHIVLHDEYIAAEDLIGNNDSQNRYDRFLVQNLLKQWNNYEPYLSNTKVKGVKNKFIEQSQPYNLDENLEHWVV